VLAAFLTAALTDVFLSSAEPVEQAAAKYFHPEFRQYVEGTEVDYPQLLDHARELRGRFASSRIHVVQVLRHGDQVAARHRVHHVTTGGTDVHGEVFLFAELAPDGRLWRATEVSRRLSPAEIADFPDARW
jgi:hypothetical protein